MNDYKNTINYENEVVAHTAHISTEDIMKLMKLNKILEKTEVAEAEQRKNLSKNPDLATYTKLLNLLHQSYEISTLTANELSSHLDIMNLSLLSAVIQKIVKGFQIQLNMFLQFQVNFFKKGKKTQFFHHPSNGSNNIFPEADLISLGSTSNINLRFDDSKKVDLTNKNIRRFSKLDLPVPRKPLIPSISPVSQQNILLSTERDSSSNNNNNNNAVEKECSIENFEQNIADLNNLIVKQEAQMYNLNLIEARNIHNNSELIQLSKDIKKQTQNNDLMNIPLENENPELSEKLPKAKKYKKEKDTLLKNKKITEILEESPQSNYSLSRKMTKMDVNQTGIPKVHTRNKGTNPDPDIFDINIIYALEQILKNRDSTVNQLEENLLNRENNIKELESMNSFIKSDYNTLKSNNEALNLRYAENKILEANLNIELNKSRKIVASLQGEIGAWEMRTEKKEQDFLCLKNKYEILTRINNENDDKLKNFSKEIDEIKENKKLWEKKFEDLRQKNKELLEENDYLRQEITEFKEIMKEDKFAEERMTYEKTIEGYEQQINELQQIISNLGYDVNQYQHLIALKDIKNDNVYLEKLRKLSLSISQNNENSPKEVVHITSKNYIDEDLVRKRTFSDTINKPNLEEIDKIKSLEYTMKEKGKIINYNVNDDKDYKPILISNNNQSLNTQTPSSFKMQNFANENNDSRRNDQRFINIWTQTEVLDSVELLRIYLKEKEINPDIWQEIYEFIEKQSLAFNSNSKKNSRKNSITNISKTLASNSDYSNIMSKILTPNSKFSLLPEQPDTKFLIKNQNQHSKPVLNLSTEATINQKFNKIIQKSNNINQINHEIFSINQKPQTNQITPQNHQKLTGSLALKQHLKGNDASSLLKQHLKGHENTKLTKIPFKLDSDYSHSIDMNANMKQFPQKIKNFSASSSNLKEDFKYEESPRYTIKNQETLNKELWELPKEEKNEIFESMYNGFTKLQENLLSSNKNHRNYLKHVILIKNIRKELNGEIDANNTEIPNLEEFKEFMERMLSKHKKCGKECSHLKRFYGKIGWNPNDRVSAYTNRIQYMPKTMIINALPKIN